MDDVVTRVRDTLKEEVSDLPGPAVATTFEVLANASSRDIESDLQGVDPDPDYANDLLWADTYNDFLVAIVTTEPRRRVQLALDALRGCTTVEEVAQAVIDYPELRRSDVFEPLITARLENEAKDGLRILTEGLRDAVRLVEQDDFHSAHEALRNSVTEWWQGAWSVETQQLGDRFEDAHDARDHASVVSLGRELLERIEPAAPATLRGHVHATIADAMGELASLGRPEFAEQAIEHYLHALSLIANDQEDAEFIRARLLTNLGTAYGIRPTGDPETNQEQAVAYFREALQYLTEDNHGDSWALALTNLGLILSERRTGNQDDNLRESRECLEAALTWRTFERDPVDWAYTQLNLGHVHSRLGARTDRLHIERAIHHASEALRGAEAASHDPMRALLLRNLSSQKFLLSSLMDDNDPAVGALVDEAERLVRESIAMFESLNATLDIARSWRSLADRLIDLHRLDEALDAINRAVASFKEGRSPRELRDAAQQRAFLTSEIGSPAESATAWLDAVDAAEGALDSRPAISGRLDEIRNSGTTFRFAAHALIRAGRSAEAVEVLERGRAREILTFVHLEAIDLSTLGSLDPALREKYLEVRSRLESVERQARLVWELPDAASARVADEFREVVEEIRSVTSLENFLRPHNLPEIALAATAEAPLVYIVAAPAGAAAIVVGNSDAGSYLEVIDTSEFTSRSLAETLTGLEPGGTGVGFLQAQAGEADDGVLEASLTHLEVVIGPLLAELSQKLRTRNATAVCIVPTGLFSLLPLHALHWQSGSEKRCLLDDFDVVFAPSAALRRLTHSRATRALPARLLAVGNPLPHDSPLPGTEWEVEQIVEAFGAESATVLLREKATKAAFLAEAPEASHIHLACHGLGLLQGRALDGTLSLANNEDLTANELLDLQLVARLVVASACQTGVPQGYEFVDELLGLTTAFLAAGAAAVVSTLWAIDDLASAVLMSLFYEDIASGLEPSRALRTAQLRFRSMTDAELTTYIAKRPVLAARRGTTPTRLPAATGVTVGSTGYALWASFTYCGA